MTFTGRATAIEAESVDAGQRMMSKAEHYLAKAEQFEAMAQKAQAETTKLAYEHLAWSYRQLGIHAARPLEAGTEPDGLPNRIVGTKDAP
jgi:hypothetical protein